MRKGQLNRHTRYRPATTTRNTGQTGAVTAVAPLGGLIKFACNSRYGDVCKEFARSAGDCLPECRFDEGHCPHTRPARRIIVHTYTYGPAWIAYQATAAETKVLVVTVTHASPASYAPAQRTSISLSSPCAPFANLLFLCFRV